MKHVQKLERSKLYEFRQKLGMTSNQFCKTYGINPTVLHNAENNKPIGSENIQKIEELFGIKLEKKKFQPQKQTKDKAAEFNRTHLFRPDLVLENYVALKRAIAMVNPPKRRKLNDETTKIPEEWLLEEVTDQELYWKIKKLAEKEVGKTYIEDSEIRDNKQADHYEVINRYGRVNYIYFYKDNVEIDVIPIVFEQI